MFKLLQKLFTKKGNRIKPVVMRMCLEPEQMNEWQNTDVIINVQNCPFITLTESKMPNVWYHDEIDLLFCLTARGFKVIKGSKKILFERGMERHYT